MTVRNSCNADPQSPSTAMRNIVMATWLALTLVLVATSAIAETWRVRDRTNLNARSGPGTEYAIVKVLRSGAVVEELERTGGWSRVRTDDGRIVFVSNRYLVRNLSGMRRERASQGTWNVSLQIGHVESISDFDFSPDGRTLATASINGTLLLWDVASGRELRRIDTELRGLTSISFSPDGHSIALGSGYGSVQLRDAATGREMQGPEVYDYRIDGISEVAFAPDGRSLLVVVWEEDTDNDVSARIWDVTGSRTRWQLPEDAREVIRAAFSPDGRTVATLSESGKVQLWDVATGHERWTLRAFDRSEKRTFFSKYRGVSAVLAFDPDGRTIVMSLGKFVRRLDAATGRELGILKEWDSIPDTPSIAFSPDGRTVAMSGDLKVGLWNVSTGKALRTLVGLHSATFSGGTFSPDGRTIVTSGGNELILWDVATGRKLRKLGRRTNPVTSVAVSPDGGTVATGSDGGSARLWDAATGQVLRGLLGHRSRITSAAFSPDGRTIAMGSWDKAVRIWDTGTGRVVRTLGGHAKSAESVAFSPDGRTIATGSSRESADYKESAVVWLWDAASGKKFRELKEFGSRRVNSLAFSPDGRLIAASGEPYTGIWEVTTGRMLKRLGRDPASTIGKDFRTLGRSWPQGGEAAFSPDGRFLIQSGSRWEIATERMLPEQDWGGDYLALSTDGRMIAANSWGSHAPSLVDAASGRVLRKLEGHLGNVTSLALSFL